MGSSLLDPRRKRRRTRAHSAGIRPTGDKRRCAISLPWVAVLFGLAMTMVVGTRKWIKSSARNAARAARTRDKSAYPLAVLLEQHDIEPQAARFADPLRRCLASTAGDGDPPAERLGLFTCIADTRFFLRGLGEALRFPSVTVVDIGNSPSHLGSEMGGAGASLAFAGRVSEVVPEMGLQARVKVGDPLPQTADLVLVEAHEEALLSSDAWVGLMRSLMQVLSESGVVVIRGPRQKGEKETAAGDVDATWQGNAQLWEAIATLACDGGHSVAAVLGEIDGGLIVVRHAEAVEEGFDAGCGSQPERQAEGDKRGVAAAATARSSALPHPLQFEELFLWATEGQLATTPKAIEAVQAQFGGAEVVLRYTRRRRDRSACIRTISGGSAAASSEPSVEGSDGNGHLRAKNRRSSSHRGGVMSSDDATSQRYLATRTCLENHLQEHKQDVRAGFALEMVLRAIGGIGVDRQVARLRARIIEESGPSADLLWRALHARAVGAAAAGSLL